MNFQVTKTTGGKRRGVLETNHGEVQTPFFMPVGTFGAVKGLSPDDVRASGAQVLLSNTYHMHLKPGEAVVKQLGGLQKFTGWHGPMLTDSGGFQVFSLGKLRKITEEGVKFQVPETGDTVMLTPEKSMQIQFDLGADIIMAFDDVVSLKGDEAGREREAMERTHRWLERCVAEHKRLSKSVTNPPALFGIVQGGLNTDYRKESLEFIQSQPVDGIAIGGLSVGETQEEMFRILEFLAPLYDSQRPHYLMGVGKPADMRFAIEHGIDMFDCVLPTRNARHGQAWVSGDKTINLQSEAHKADEQVLDPGCDCTTCQAGYSRAFLRHLFNINEYLAGRLVSVHNLHYVARLMEEARS
jgi:queuine tRNA-ribosyltransferase